MRDTPPLPCEPDKGSPIRSLQRKNPNVSLPALKVSLSNEIAYTKEVLKRTPLNNTPLVDSLLSRLHTLLSLRGSTATK